MKIYTRTAFMQLPPGIIYAKGKPWYWGDLNIKDETIFHEGKAVDFLTQSLVDIESNGTNQWFDRLEEMRSAGTSYPLIENQSRDGSFGEEDLFLVYEPADLAKLIGYVVNAIMTWGETK